MDGEGAGHQPGWQFSPLLIGLLGVIAGFMMVATYHCISLGCCCCNNNQQAQDNEPNTRQDTERNYDHRQEWPRDRIRTSSMMRVLMPVFRFSSKDCNEDTCAVCLGDFKEGEQVRVLPECLHLFHVPCIDMWLSSHSNCPLCRANANAAPPPHLVLTLPDSGLMDSVVLQLCYDGSWETLADGHMKYVNGNNTAFLIRKYCTFDQFLAILMDKKKSCRNVSQTSIWLE
ncbi:hypothetical protein KPL70_017623 [Citrus sinensis]|nr:hypothetical protein KPL70_017623 [Citrus sinensis]